MFMIEDDIHAENIASFETRAEALTELRRLAATPWDVHPNICPCTSWRTCGREYQLIEYDTSTRPWRELNSTPALSVSAKGHAWRLADGEAI